MAASGQLFGRLRSACHGRRHPGYTGTIVHDGWASYGLFADAAHAQCGAHLIRHLSDVGKTPALAIWTAQMIGVLLGAKLASETAAAAGLGTVDIRTASALRAKYHATLDVAFALLPAGAPPRVPPHWRLEQRLSARRGTSPPECAGRRPGAAPPRRHPWKLHDKISGCFYSSKGANAFADVRSYLQTAANHGENRLDVLRRLFIDGPWLPPPRVAEGN